MRNGVSLKHWNPIESFVRKFQVFLKFHNLLWSCPNVIISTSLWASQNEDSKYRFFLSGIWEKSIFFWILNASVQKYYILLSYIRVRCAGERVCKYLLFPAAFILFAGLKTNCSSKSVFLHSSPLAWYCAWLTIVSPTPLPVHITQKPWVISWPCRPSPRLKHDSRKLPPVPAQLSSCHY